MIIQPQASECLPNTGSWNEACYERNIHLNSSCLLFLSGKHEPELTETALLCSMMLALTSVSETDFYVSDFMKIKYFSLWLLRVYEANVVPTVSDFRSGSKTNLGV